jgi:farnesyl-diphosphate farnesyltransferase
MDPTVSDEAYQGWVLPQVSRTFALTIPQLPPDLRRSVTNAYLLCRIADTIEDQTDSSAAARLGFLHRFVAVLEGREEAALLARDLGPRLVENTPPAERELVLNMGRIVRLTAGLASSQRAAIERCVRVMCEGMHRFQCTASLNGLARMTDLDEYCFFVAGVVGQMLTDMFCSYAPAINRRRAELERLSISYAEGLQLTNILKDVWEDHERGVCWLPREVFARCGVGFGTLRADQQPPGFAAGMRELVGVAHAHLRNALSFALLIPRREAGIRRFCLWAIGLAVLTLRRIENTPGFTCGAQVKISHAAVSIATTLSNVSLRNDWLLRRLFDLAATGLPLAQLSTPTVSRFPPSGEVRSPTDLLESASHTAQHEQSRSRSSGH